MSFSVATDPWIPLLMRDGTVRDVSIVEALTGDGVRICSELATLDTAIIRLLTAVHRRSNGQIADYVARDPNRWLLDSTTPFMQVPGLTTTNGAQSPASSLLPNTRHFTNPSPSSLTLAEAARWLVHLQAFDRSGIRPGMIGDPDVVNGKGMPRGSGWAARSTHILPDTARLTDTIQLLSHTNQPDAPAAWERQQTAARRTDAPQGVSDLLTWQSRRVRLVITNNQVTNCVIGQGDRVDDPPTGLDPTMLNGARGPVRATGPAWWILGRDDLTMPPWLNTAPDIVINLRLVTAQQGPTASVWEDIRATTLHAVPLGRLNDVTRGCRAGRQTVSALANLAGHLAGIAGAATTTQAGESEQWREHAREELSTAVESWISRGAPPPTGNPPFDPTSSRSSTGSPTPPRPRSGAETSTASRWTTAKPWPTSTPASAEPPNSPPKPVREPASTTTPRNSEPISVRRRSSLPARPLPAPPAGARSRDAGRVPGDPGPLPAPAGPMVESSRPEISARTTPRACGPDLTARVNQVNWSGHSPRLRARSWTGRCCCTAIPLGPLPAPAGPTAPSSKSEPEWHRDTHGMREASAPLPLLAVRSSQLTPRSQSSAPLFTVGDCHLDFTNRDIRPCRFQGKIDRA